MKGRQLTEAVLRFRDPSSSLGVRLKKFSVLTCCFLFFYLFVLMKWEMEVKTQLFIQQ